MRNDKEVRLRQGSSQQQQQASLRELDELEQKLLEAVESATSELDSKGRKITLKKPQADLLQRLQHQKGLKSAAGLTGGLLDHQNSDNTPFLSTNREGVVQSRLIRFGTQSPSNGSRESSPAPSDASATSGSTLISRNGTHESNLNQKRLQNNYDSSNHHGAGNTIGNSEKTVFGISPKSSSLSR